MFKALEEVLQTEENRRKTYDNSASFCGSAENLGFGKKSCLKIEGFSLRVRPSSEARRATVINCCLR
jgi:hypothetical protein